VLLGAMGIGVPVTALWSQVIIIKSSVIIIKEGACHGAVVPGCLDDDEGQALGSSPAAGCIKTRNRACVSEVDVTGKDT
jgi:hypothetical protein